MLRQREGEGGSILFALALSLSLSLSFSVSLFPPLFGLNSDSGMIDAFDVFQVESGVERSSGYGVHDTPASVASLALHPNYFFVR